MPFDSNPAVKNPLLDDLSGILFAAYLTIGSFKSLPWLSALPFDITVALGVVCGVALCVQFFGSGLLVPHAFWWVIFLYLTFFLGVFMAPSTDYGHDKVSRLFTLTFLATVFPIFAMQSQHSVRRFLESLGWIGAILMGIGIFNLMTTGQLDRLEVNDSSTISLARIVGISMILVLCLIQSKRIGMIPGAVAMGAMGVVMVATGSRGPIIAFLAVLIVLGITFSSAALSRTLRFVALVVVSIVVLAFLYPRMPATSTARLESFIKGEWGNSEEARALALERATDIIPRTPAGIGWGGFDSLPTNGPQETIKFVHNLFVEVFLEGGWLPGIMFLLVFLIAIGRSYRLMRASQKFEATATFSIFFFCALNTLVSGEINNERIFFAFFGLALAGAAAPAPEYVETLSNGLKSSAEESYYAGMR